MAEKRDDRIIVYVGGESVDRETVDPRVALDLAVAYVDMMQKMADEREQELDLHGLEIVPGSVGFAMHSRTPKEARLSVREVDRIMSGRSEPTSQRGERAYSRLVRAIDSLPEGYTANVVVGNFRRQLAVMRAPVPQGEIWSSTTLRAFPFKVGGAKTPKVWFRSLSEDKPFGVTTDVPTAQKVAHHLYAEVEVTFRFVRDPEDGTIESGVLESFRPVVSMPDEIARWREWFSEAGEHWKDVVDIDTELGRGDAGDQ